MIKKLSLFMVMLFSIWGISSYKAEALSYETFIRYDLKTGETSRIIVPGELFGEFEEEEPDEKVAIPERAPATLASRANASNQSRVTNVSEEPYKWIGQLLCSDSDITTGTITGTSGSAALIGDRYALTAAHVVYRKDKKRPWQTIHFFAGGEKINGVNVPYGKIATAVYVPEAYQKESLNTSTVIHDYAVLEFEFELAPNYGHFNVYVSNRLDSFDPSVHTPFCTANVAGFPAEGVSKAGLYKAQVPVTIWKNYVLDYDETLFPGQSGGPIYRKINGKYQLLGINCQLVFNSNGTFKCSRGRCITPTLKNFIANCK